MTKWIRKAETPSDLPANQIHDTYTESSSDTYSCNYMNKSAITLLSNNQSHTGAKWSVVQIKVTGSNAAGTGFSRSGNYVIVNRPMRAVLVSAAMALTSNSYSYSGDLYICLYNSAGQKRAEYQFRGYAGSGGKTAYIPPAVWVGLQAGDKIDFGHYTGSNSDTFTTVDNNSTWLTVQEL